MPVRVCPQAATGLRTTQRGLTSGALASRGVEAARAIYVDDKGPRGPQLRRSRAAVVSLIVDRPFLRDALLDCFIRSCSTTLRVSLVEEAPIATSSTSCPFRVPVQHAVRAAASSLRHGCSVKGGMLEVLRGILRWLMRDHLRATLLSLAADYGLEPLARLGPVTDEQPQSAASPLPVGNDALMRAFVSRALPGLVSTLLADTAIKSASLADIVPVPCSQGIVAPSLPLFALVYAPLKKLVSRALSRTLAAGGSSAGDVEVTARALLREGCRKRSDGSAAAGGLESVLRGIEDSPLLFDLFTRDMLSSRLGFARALPHELTVLAELVRLLLLEQRRGEPLDADAEATLGGASEDPLPALSCVRLLLLDRDPVCTAALSQVGQGSGGAEGRRSPSPPAAAACRPLR